MVSVGVEVTPCQTQCCTVASQATRTYTLRSVDPTSTKTCSPCLYTPLLPFNYYCLVAFSMKTSSLLFVLWCVSVSLANQYTHKVSNCSCVYYTFLCFL